MSINPAHLQGKSAAEKWKFLTERHITRDVRMVTLTEHEAREIAATLAAAPPAAGKVWRLLVPKVDRIAKGDEYFHAKTMLWLPVEADDIGMPVDDDDYPIRRRYTPAAPAAEGGEHDYVD